MRPLSKSNALPTPFFRTSYDSSAISSGLGSVTWAGNRKMIVVLDDSDTIEIIKWRRDGTNPEQVGSSGIQVGGWIEI